MKIKLAQFKGKFKKGIFASQFFIEKNLYYEKQPKNGAKYLSICSSILAALAG